MGYKLIGLFCVIIVECKRAIEMEFVEKYGGMAGW